MKIINSKVFFPKGKSKVNTNYSLPLDDKRPRFSSSDLILEKTLPLCKELLEESDFNPTDIDLILNITLSPDRLFQDKTIGVPRVSHPVQYLLKADNAFVVDIHESDWNTAFTVAKAFMFDQKRKNVLIVRTEFLHESVHPDYESGFTIPDGVAAILAVKESNVIETQYEYLITKDNFCRYDMIKKGSELAKGQFRSKLTFNYLEKYIDDLNETGQKFIDKLLDNNQVDYVVFESWFPIHNFSINDKRVSVLSTRNDMDFKSMGVFSLPFYLQNLNPLKGEKKVLNISYSPFLNRYSASILSC